MDADSLDRMEVAQNAELAKALRTEPGKIITEMVEKVLTEKVTALVMNRTLQPDERMNLAIECAAIGDLLREIEGRVEAVIQLATRRLTREAMQRGR